VPNSLRNPPFIFYNIQPPKARAEAPAWGLAIPKHKLWAVKSPKDGPEKSSLASVAYSFEAKPSTTLGVSNHTTEVPWGLHWT